MARKECKIPKTPNIFHAAISENLIQFKTLVENGADINAVDKANFSLITVCVYHRRLDFVQYLIAKNVCLNINTKPPLHMAVSKNEMEITKSLIQAGANINGLDENGMAPIFVAIKPSQGKILKFLIESGANVNTMGNNGEYPLHYAAKHGNLDAVFLLARSGAELKARNRHNETALQSALRRKLLVTSQILIEESLLRDEAAVKPRLKHCDPSLETYWCKCKSQVSKMNRKIFDGSEMTLIDILKEKNTGIIIQSVVNIETLHYKYMESICTREFPLYTVATLNRFKEIIERKNWMSKSVLVLSHSDLKLAEKNSKIWYNLFSYLRNEDLLGIVKAAPFYQK